IELRATAHQKSLLEAAAKLSNTTVTDFILKIACYQAECLLQHDQQEAVDHDDWTQFCIFTDEGAVQGPAHDIQKGMSFDTGSHQPRRHIQIPIPISTGAISW